MVAGQEALKSTSRNIYKPVVFIGDRLAAGRTRMLLIRLFVLIVYLFNKNNFWFYGCLLENRTVRVGCLLMGEMGRVKVE